MPQKGTTKEPVGKLYSMAFASEAYVLRAPSQHQLRQPLVGFRVLGFRVLGVYGLVFSGRLRLNPKLEIPSPKPAKANSKPTQAACVKP